MDNVEKNLPLEGVKVVAFTHAVMGPAAGLILADLGAEVIHIEPPTGDTTRRLKGFGIGYFAYFNRNKKSFAIDLKAPESKEILFKMIGSADILLENFGPGTIERLGLGYDVLSKHNPKLIYVALKGFLPGPYEKRVAMDEVVQMMGGLAYMTGPPGTPLRAGTSVVDINGGMFAAIAAITALYDRQRTGKGTYIKSALFETTAFLMGQHMAVSAITQQPVPPMPDRVSAWSIYQLFETSDNEQVFVGIISEKHWALFCNAFQRQDWLDDPRLKTNNDRIAERDWFLPAVKEMLKGLSKQEIVDKCDAAGVCFAPISRPEDLFDDPQLNSGAYGLVETTFPDGKTAKMPRLPLQFGSYDLKKRSDPPSKIGSDTREILTSMGYDTETIDNLAKKNIIALGD